MADDDTYYSDADEEGGDASDYSDYSDYDDYDWGDDDDDDSDSDHDWDDDDEDTSTPTNTSNLYTSDEIKGYLTLLESSGIDTSDMEDFLNVLTSLGLSIADVIAISNGATPTSGTFQVYNPVSGEYETQGIEAVDQDVYDAYQQLLASNAFTEDEINNLIGWLETYDLSETDMAYILQNQAFDFDESYEELQAKYQEYIDDLNSLTETLATIAEQYQGSLTDISDEYQTYLDELLAEMSAGTSQYTDETWEYVAQTLGYDSAEDYFQAIEDMQNTGVEDVTGLSDEALDTLQRQMRATLSEMEQTAQDQLEAVFASTGSYTRYLAAADEVRQEIADERLSYEVEILNEDYARRLDSLERMDEQWSTLISTGQATASEYLQLRTQAVQDAYNAYLEALTTKIDITEAQWNQDVQTVLMQANLIAQAALTEMGIDESILSQLESLFEADNAEEILAAQLESLQAQSDAATTSNVVGIIGALASVAAAAAAFF